MFRCEAWADWEAFHAQFELLPRAAAFSDATKALQRCLTNDALADNNRNTIRGTTETVWKMDADRLHRGKTDNHVELEQVRTGEPPVALANVI